MDNEIIAKTFDEQRAEFLKNEAALKLLNESVQESSNKAAGTYRDFKACEILEQQFDDEVKILKAREERNVRTFNTQKEQLKSLIEYDKVTLEREEYEKPLPEDIEELYRLYRVKKSIEEKKAAAEKRIAEAEKKIVEAEEKKAPEEKKKAEEEKKAAEEEKKKAEEKSPEEEKSIKEYEDYKVRLDTVFLLAGKRAVKPDAKTKTILDEYFTARDAYDRECQIYSKELGDLFLPDSLEKLEAVIKTDEKLKDSIISRIGGLVFDQNFYDDLTNKAKNYQKNERNLAEEETMLKVANEEKKNLTDEIKSIKKLDKDSIDKSNVKNDPDVKKYLDNQKLIDNTEKGINELKIIDEMKLPDTFTDLNKLDPEKKKKSEAVIDAIVKARAISDGDKAATNSLNTYYAKLGEQDMLNNIINSKPDLISTDLEEILLLENKPSETAKHEGLSVKIDKVKRLRTELLSKKEKMLSEKYKYVKTLRDMKDLRKLKKDNPEEYKYVEEHIDSLISGLGIKEVNTLQDHLDRVDKQKTLAEKIVNESNKRTIKNAIDNSNNFKANYEKAHPDEVKNILVKNQNEYKDAEENLKKAEEELLKLVKAKNDIIVTNHKEKISKAKEEEKKLAKELATVKAYIKDSVANKKKEISANIKLDEEKLKELKNQHNKNKKEFYAAVDAYYKSSIEKCDKDIKQHEENIVSYKKDIKSSKEAYDAANKKIFDAVAENNAKGKKVVDYEGVKKRGRNITVYKSNLDKSADIIQKCVAENNLKYERLIKKDLKTLDNSFGKRHDEYVNATIMEDMNNRTKDARNKYYGAYLKDKGLGLAARVMNFAAEKLEEGVIITGKAIIKGERASLDNQRKNLIDRKHRIETLNANENYNNMINSTGETGISNEAARSNINRDELMENEEKELSEISPKIVEFSKKITELEANENERLRSFEVSIVGRPEEVTDADRKVRERVAEIRTDVITSAMGEDHVSAVIAKANEDIIKEHNAVLDEIDEERRNKANAREARINDCSDKIKGLLTPENMARIDTGIDVTIKAVKLIKDLLADSNESEAEDTEEKKEDGNEDEADVTRQSLIDSFREMVDNLPDSFDDEAKANPQFIPDMMKILPDLVNKVNAISAYIDEKAEKANKEVDFSKRYYEMQKEQQSNYRDFIKASKKAEAENSIKTELNLLEHQVNKIDNKIDTIKTGTSKQITTIDEARIKLAEKKEEAKLKCNSQKNILEKAETKYKNDSISFANQKEMLIKDFSQAVKNGEKNSHIRPVLSVQDIENTDMSGFEFLSKLTGITFSENMNAIDLMRNFEKVYINGINAVSYFGLADDLKQAMHDDMKLEQAGGGKTQSELTKSLIEKVGVRGLEIQTGLRYITTTDPKMKGSLSKSSLAGQLIAVEDKDMHLNALSISNPEIDNYKKGMKMPEKPEKETAREMKQYNRQMAEYNANMNIYKNNKAIMDYNGTNNNMHTEFNDMRSYVADIELKGEKVINKEVGLTKAVKQREKISVAILGGKGL